MSLIGGVRGGGAGLVKICFFFFYQTLFRKTHGHKREGIAYGKHDPAHDQPLAMQRKVVFRKFLDLVHRSENELDGSSSGTQRSDGFS